MPRRTRPANGASSRTASPSGSARWSPWENAAAYLSGGTARFTITSWARSILSTAPDLEVPLDARSAVAAALLLPALAVGGWLVATLRHRRADVD